MPNMMTTVMDVTVEDYYAGLDEWLREIKYMNLARWKIIQNTLISVLVAYLAVAAGADPTAAIAVIALINGISIADLATVWGNRTPPVDEPQNKANKNETSKNEQRKN